MQHTFLSARVRTRSEGAYLAAFPQVEGEPAATDGAIVKGIVDRLAELDPHARLTPGEAVSVRLVPAKELAGACKNLGFACEKAVGDWPEGKRVALVLPFPASLDGGTVTTPWAHVRHVTPHPILPFSDPPGEGPTDAAPQPVDDDHPPRVDVWVELGIESKTGAWERSLDTAAHGLEKPLAACYAKILAKSPRAVGDVHAQIRLPAEGKPTIDATRASSPTFEPVARCLGLELERGELPRLAGKNAPMEIHATLKPPIALPRMFRAVVLTSLDAEARLGEPESERLPPETKLVASFEVPPAALRRAFDDAIRPQLGLDLSERWRLLVLESTAEKHGDTREVAFRTLAFPTPAPGEAPLPIVDAGDRPRSQTSTPVRFYRRVAVQRLGLAALLALGIAATIMLDGRGRTTGRRRA